MARPPPNLVENTIKTNQSKDYPQKAKGMSFFAFIFSVFIYISVFYIFNLSPSTLLSNHKFWFFISNTLIIIIAADYGAFTTSCKSRFDIYEDYVINNQQVRNNNSSSFASRYQVIVDKTNIQKSSELVPEKILEIDSKAEPEKLVEINVESDKSKKKQQALEPAANEAYGKKNEKKRTYKRSKSDKSNRVVVIDESKNTFHRSGSDQKLEDPPSKEEENDVEDEFSAMSNEEVNRRVEEFIKNFNRQIRLQNATGKYEQAQYDVAN